jgi:polyhydroxybutyrate depolymerase
MKNPITFLFIFVLFIAGARAQQTIDYSINVGGEVRDFTVYVPSSYDGSEEYPCVYSFHSYYTLMSSWLTKFDIRPVAEQENFLLVYPHGKVVNLNYNPVGGPANGLGWNTGSITTSTIDDVAFIEDLYDHILTQFEVDENRIYAYGHGIGGLFAHQVTNAMPNKFAAVAAVSLADTVQSTQVIPTLFMKGTASFYWPDAGVPGVFPALQDIIDQKVATNNCNVNPILYRVPDTCTTDSSSVEILTYVDGDNRSEVVFYRIVDGGYAFPGQAPLSPGGEIAGPVNNDIDASAEIWKFFKKHIRNYNPHPELIEHFVQVGFETRSYKMYIPASYDGSVEWPVVLSYHPYYTLVETWMRKFDMRAIADSEEFIIAFPKGEVVSLNLSAPGLPGNGYGWNLGGLSTSNLDDEAFSLAMLEKIKTDYQIDESRVYASGFSLGGAMAHRLGKLHPDKFAAVATVAIPDTTQITGDVPVLVMHGTEDATYPLMGIPGAYPALTTFLDEHILFSNCDLAPTTTNLENSNYVDSSTVEIHEYLNCNNNVEVVYYMIIGGNHSYPGQVPYSSGDINNHINRDIDAGTEIWKFFTGHSNPNMNEVQSIASNNDELKVFPNPTRDQINIEFEVSTNSNVSVNIFNTLGVSVYHFESSAMIYGRQMVTVDNLNLKNGIYFVKVSEGNLIQTRSVLVNR